ncbi:MAG: DUF6530 family protein [Clostridia bacterium]|nr:DUF6530 family protein [Clostridia bacterium]
MVPTHLRHRPLYCINEYEQFDGIYANNTDVIGLSLGRAQWNNITFIPSVKVWRTVQSGGRLRISRQSEETTLTRAFDMATLAIKTYYGIINGKEIEGDLPILNIEIERSNINMDEELENYFKENKEMIESHIKMLKKVLDDSKL